MRWTLVACSILAVWALLARQVPRPSDPAPADEWKRLCTLEGRTINAGNGKTISGVLLTLRLGGPSDTARVLESISGSKGRFKFEFVTPGVYTLSAALEGYANTSYGASSAFSYGTPLVLSPGQAVSNLEVKLVRLGSISGRVVDERGKGIGPVGVSAIPVYRRVDLDVAPAGIAPSNGRFEIRDLAPGPYLLLAEPEDFLVQRAPGMPRAPRNRPALRGVYYTSATDSKMPTQLEVQAGKRLSDIKIKMPKRTGYTVSGRVIDRPPSVMPELLSVRLIPEQGQASPVSARLAPDGSFVLRDIERGSYALAIRQFLTLEALIVSRGWVHLEVAGHDVGDVRAPFRDFVRLSGVVRVEGREQADYGATSVVLSPVLDFGDREPVSQDPRFRVGRIGGRRGPIGINPRIQEVRVRGPLQPETAVQDDGRFAIAEIPPNTYSVRVVGLPGGTYVKSVRLDGKELLPPEIDLNQRTTEVKIEVVLSARAAIIDGTVRNAGAPAGGSWITLIPTTGSPIFKPAITGETGQFRWSGVPPGNYRLYAWQELPYRALTDRAYLSGFSNRAVDLTLREGDRARVQVTLIQAAELGAR